MLPCGLLVKLQAQGSALVRVDLQLRRTQRAQYPFIKEYTLNHQGLHIMI